MSSLRRETLECCPEPPTTPAEALAHVVAIYDDEPDDRMMIHATSNIYGPGVRTGLTMGDLRSLHRLSQWNQKGEEEWL
ncbi:hypothetical protein ACIF6L_26525 [Kitasatospora sp. NPDC086009]|uniref:hypothetical protein n=1 Tax=unclassified Kitasatospora TaxID=2633591 RepID=UPI0037CABC3F